jgi:uncharacterized protein YjbI with pentapeptide repeats
MAGRGNQTPKPRRSDPAPGPAADAVQPKLSPSVKKFAGKARDLEALRDAVVDAASVGAGLWLSYLFLFFYLFIAAAAVTHKDLFFENPVKLPFLNVELPLLGFFWLGPLLFIVLHAYVLLHFALLADKVGVFHVELVTQIKDHDTRRRLRRQLPSNIFVQYLAGPRDVRDSIMGLMLRAIALITLVVFPIALLVFFQLQFLPYHDAWITWWQRFAVLLDILLLWTLWPSIAQGKTTWISLRDFSRGKVIALALLSAAPLLLVFTIATFPGEWLDTKLPPFRFVPTQWPTDQPKESEETLGNGSEPADGNEGKELRTFWQKVNDRVKSMSWTSPHDLLVAGDVDLIARKPGSLWSNRLVLPGIDVIDHTKFDSEDKIAALPETLSLRGRHLEGAILIGDGLRRVDLTGAQLQGANLQRADLRGAKFGCAATGREDESYDCTNLQLASLSSAQLQGVSLEWLDLRGADLIGTELQDARLDNAKLQKARLDAAKLQRASLIATQLQGAWLDEADLQGAQLDKAQLQEARLNGASLKGASLKDTQLQGASLDEAKLQGADLEDANLQGASLWHAELQGASLDGAELQAAVLEEAQLQGVSLEDAELQGATLHYAQLQGADLTGANLSLASLDSVSVWRSDPQQATMEGALIVYVKVEDSDWSTESFTKLRSELEAEIPAGIARDNAVERIAVLDPAKAPPDEAGIAAAWVNLARDPYASRNDYNVNLADGLLKLACNTDEASYVIHGLLLLPRLREFDRLWGTESAQLMKLAKGLLDEASCPGTRGLSEEDKNTLKAIRDQGEAESRSGPP